MSTQGTRAEENPHAGQGSVLLDIGGPVGALVVTMPAALVGEEVEIGRRGPGDRGADHAGPDHAQDHDGHDHGCHDHGKRDHGRHDHGGREHGDHDHSRHRPHVAVVARPVADGVTPSLVFPELLEGDYDLYRRAGGPVALSVSITGGAVTEADWPPARPAA